MKEYVQFKNQSHEESESINATDPEKALKVIIEWSEDKDKVAYVILDGSKIIGQLFIEFNQKEKNCHIALISVLEAYYGKGAAKQLVEKAISETNHLHINNVEFTVNPNNIGGIKIYEKIEVLRFKENRVLSTLKIKVN